MGYNSLIKLFFLFLGEQPVPSSSASEEVNQFDYICTLLSKKNFSLSETVSMMDLSELEKMKPKSSLAIRRVSSPCVDPLFGNVDDDFLAFLNKPKSKSMSNLLSMKDAVLPRNLSVPTDLVSCGELDEVIEIDDGKEIEKVDFLPSLKLSRSCSDLKMIPSTMQCDGECSSCYLLVICKYL